MVEARSSNTRAAQMSKAAAVEQHRCQQGPGPGHTSDPDARVRGYPGPGYTHDPGIPGSQVLSN